MSRAPFQVLVLPFWDSPDGQTLYAIFRREASTGGYWQGISGGGEDNETPLEAARREAFEEAGIEPRNEFIPLRSVCTIPVVNIAGFQWGASVLVIPEYCFGAKLANPTICLSDEHSEYRWVTYDEGISQLQWDSNKNALWELDHRISHHLSEELTHLLPHDLQEPHKVI